MKKKNKEIIYTFKKFKLGNVILRNRIISSPISINMANKFASGKNAIAECDRCGFQYKLKQLKELTIKPKMLTF